MSLAEKIFRWLLPDISRRYDMLVSMHLPYIRHQEEKNG